MSTAQYLLPWNFVYNNYTCAIIGKLTQGTVHHYDRRKTKAYRFRATRRQPMKDLAFGLTMTIMGMGITFVTLYLLTLVIRLLNRLYPFKEEKEDKS